MGGQVEAVPLAAEAPGQAIGYIDLSHLAIDACRVADRTPHAAARGRNARHVEAGTAEFLVAELESLDLGERRFDLAFAVRVGLFHSDPERAHALAERWLAPGGRVCSFFDPPLAR